MKGLPYVGSLIVSILISSLVACSGGLFGSEDNSSKPPAVLPNTIPVAVGRSIVSLAYVGDPITFDATGSSDADAGAVLTYAWNFGDQTPVGSGITTTHIYTVEGIFKVILTVSDGKDSKISELYVTVAQRRNQAPLASMSNYQTYINVEAGTALSVNASGSSDPDGDTLAFEWNFGDGGQNASTAIAQKIYSNPGVFVVRLTVSDGTDEDELAFAVNVATPPEAHSTIILPNGTKTTTAAVKDSVSLGFDGTASLDRDGTIQSWNWNFGDGLSASGGEASHAYGNPGVYSAILTVTDNAGKTANATPLVITVSATPPVANAGVNQELASDSDPDSSFSLDGTGSDGVGTLTYSWSLFDAAGGSIPLSSPSSPFISLLLTDLDPDLIGPFRAQLIVSDTYGQSSIDSIYLSIIDINTADTVQPVGVIKPPAQDQETLDALSELSLVLSSSVTSRSISRSLISSRDLIPKVYALVGRPVYFDGARSYDPGGLQTGIDADASLTYAWNFGDADATQPTTGAVIAHRFATAGIKSVTLAITDDEGTESGTVTRELTVLDLPNKAPRADAGSSKTAYIGDSVSFQANALNTGDEDGLIINYAWDFNDGSPVANSATSAAVTHIYANPGAYLVTLTVTDNGARDQNKIAKTATDTVSVVVRRRPENTAPVPLPGQNKTIIVGESVLFDASASFDPDPAGSIVSYAWKLGGVTLSTAVRYIHTFETVGTNSVELTVTDNGGNGNPAKSASATITITVAEKPPVALMVNVSVASGTEISPTKPMVFKYYEIVDGTEWWKLAPVAERTIEAPGKYGMIVTDFKRPDGSFAWDVSKKFAMKFEHHVSGSENPYWGFLNTVVPGGVSYALPQNGVLAATQLDPASISELTFNDALASATVSVDAF